MQYAQLQQQIGAEPSAAGIAASFEAASGGRVDPFAPDAMAALAAPPGALDAPGSWLFISGLAVLAALSAGCRRTERV